MGFGYRGPGTQYGSKRENSEVNKTRGPDFSLFSQGKVYLECKVNLQSVSILVYLFL